MKKNVRDYKVNGKQYAYILDAIVPENVDIDSDGMSDSEKMIVLLEQFNKEANYPYNKQLYKSVVERFCEWTKGLPSVFCIEFNPYNIKQIGKSWGYCQTEKKADNFAENWFMSISCKVFQLAHRLGVDTTKYM